MELFLMMGKNTETHSQIFGGVWGILWKGKEELWESEGSKPSQEKSSFPLTAQFFFLYFLRIF